jgi:hypothetical protein
MTINNTSGISGGSSYAKTGVAIVAPDTGKRQGNKIGASAERALDEVEWIKGTNKLNF